MGGLTPGAAGMKLGESFKFVDKSDMPGLEAHRIAEACDKLIAGSGAYKSLLYLSRARVTDIAEIFEASRSNDVQCRWQRLWVLCPILARLARLDAGRDTIVSDCGKDLAALHMLARFDPSKNVAPKKFFERVREDLLSQLLDVMVGFLEDESRSQLVAGIIAVVETSGPILERLLIESHGSQLASQVMPMLLVSDPSELRQKVLSPQDIRRRLEHMRNQGG